MNCSIASTRHHRDWRSCSRKSSIRVEKSPFGRFAAISTPPSSRMIISSSTRFPRESSPSCPPSWACWIPRFCPRLPPAISRSSLLLALLQQLDQNAGFVREMGIFRDILRSFRVLCRRETVGPESVLIFAVILHSQMLQPECTSAPIFGDNLTYGVAALVQLLGLVGERKSGHF